MERIVWQPGYRLDWSDRDNIVVRDADGRVVFDDLHIERADLERLIAQVMAGKAARAPKG